jgi:L,D-peptidoglycan transpeptidase YkuD (ErfK/YbiS/YcfS/YnhG family)
VVRVRAGVAGLAAAVLCICGAAAAGVTHSPVAQRHVTRASPAAPGTLAAASAAAPPARPVAASAVRRARGQLVTVIAASYGVTHAELTAYQRVGGQWRRVFGPWMAWIGRHGMAAPGTKLEGDGRTPSGTFGFGFFFGVDPDPGVHFSYRKVHMYDVWDDDPSSPLYNEWVDDRYANPGADPEPMDVPAYDFGAVIGYNTARTPGLGSAIFLHVNTGMPTAGCVTLPAGELLEILRWLNPAASPRIAMGHMNMSGLVSALVPVLSSMIVTSFSKSTWAGPGVRAFSISIMGRGVIAGHPYDYPRSGTATTHLARPGHPVRAPEYPANCSGSDVVPSDDDRTSWTGIVCRTREGCRAVFEAGGLKGDYPNSGTGTTHLARQGLHQCFEGRGPAFPVGAARLGRDGRDELVPERFPVAAERVLDDRGRQREYRALPGRVESQLPVAARQVQVLQAQLRVHSRATPIIESLVTSPASSASVIASVSGGRSGSTR